MNQFHIRRCRNGVCGRGLAGLRQLFAQFAFGAMQRARQPISDIVRQVFARQHKAHAVIRGLRALSDFEFEFNMALMNRHLEPQVETIFVMPNEAYSYTSSSLVKQIAKLGGDVSKFVPANVAAALRETFPAKKK